MKIINSVLLICASLFLCACQTTSITETVYDADGKPVNTRITQTSGNPFVLLAKNSASKSWALHQGGWYTNVGYADWGIVCASLDNTIVSVADSPNGVNAVKEFGGVLNAAKYSLSVSKEGVSSGSEKVSTLP